jgi:hypothetical protein
MTNEDAMKRSAHWVPFVIACALAAAGSAASAQTSTPKPDMAAVPAATSSPLDTLAWLRGCWAGKVEQRDFVEQWQPPLAGMMVGVSETIVHDPKRAGESRVDDYTYLRLVARADGVYYIAIPSGKSELPFKLTATSTDQGDQIFTFANGADAFPQRIVYRHTKLGLLFAEVDGKVNGRDKQVIYPMHRVDCVTGAE